MTTHGNYEVAVLGAGMAGLAAGLRLAEAGHRVAVLERSGRVGGAMSLSAGLVWAFKDFKTARTFMPLGDPVLQSLQTRNFLRYVNWLEGHGLPFGPLQACMAGDVGVGREFALGTAGNRQPFADRLAESVRLHNGSIMLGAGLMSCGWDGRWGLSSEDGSVEVESDHLIVATGGFQNSVELVRRFVSPEAASLRIRSTRTSDGTALQLAEQFGLQLSRGMSSFYGHSVPYLTRRHALSEDDFIPASQYYSNQTLAVNSYGLRFVDESESLIDEGLAEAGSRQPGARYFLIFDSRVMEEFVATSKGLPGINRSRGNNFAYARRLGAWVAEADTLDDLCDQLADRGVPKENVDDTIREYNDVQDPLWGLDPPRRRSHRRLNRPPYFAMECQASITATNGGLRVDSGMRAEVHAGRNGPRVHAAGADAGGVFKGAYGGGLSWALVSGLIAAESVEAHLLNATTRSE